MWKATTAMISCLMVTQAARTVLAARAIGDFALQTHRERELIIVHDGDATFDAALSALAAKSGPGSIRVLRVAPGQSLGTLRNLCVGAAGGDYVCQWDDDDRYHPERLALQWRALGNARADFCFLSDQLHWFPARGELFWDDWDREPYPLNFVQGSLLGRRDRMPQYPDLARGEDTAAILEILRRGDSIVRLRDAGWCQIYVCHGGNAWPAAHHAAISDAKRYRLVRLLRNEAELRRRLAEYRPGIGVVRMPHEAGELVIDASADPAGHQTSK